MKQQEYTYQLPIRMSSEDTSDRHQAEAKTLQQYFITFSSCSSSQEIELSKQAKSTIQELVTESHKRESHKSDPKILILLHVCQFGPAMPFSRKIIFKCLFRTLFHLRLQFPQVIMLVNGDFFALRIKNNLFYS